MTPAYNPYCPIPDHWKRPPVKAGPSLLTEALVQSLGNAVNIITAAPEFDPFIRGSSSGLMRTLREMRMIENVGVCRHGLTPLGRALRLHLQNGASS